MIIRLVGTDDGQVLLSFVRDDGSVSERHASRLFVQHELMHYAVESCLRLNGGMLGLIAGGRDVQEFDAAARNWLPMEAQHAEAIVGALEAEVYGSAASAEFAANLSAICDDVGVPPPALIPPYLLADVRSAFAELAAQWQSLPEDGVLELPWHIERR